jgi:hypothetical protein
MRETPRGDATWVSEVLEAVAVFSGDRVRDATAAWDRFAAHPQVVVTVYGPVKAGKSSLVKRLLVEAGVPVPLWVTISGRPETFVAGEVACGDLVLVDTPGTGSDNETHGERASAALAATDVLIVAWPPGIATAEHPQLTAVICGDYYGHPADGYFPADALLIVIGRMDSLHPDVTRDVAGFYVLCDEKRAQLADVIAAARSTRGMRPDPVISLIHPVCADPFGLVGHEIQPEVADYDSGREWDGIGGLRDALDALPLRRPELRAAAAIRYWSRVALEVVKEITDEEAKLAAGAGESDVTAARLRALAADLRHVKDSAQEDLRQQILAELRSAANAAPEDQDVARALVDDRLDRVCTAWATKWSAHVSSVLNGRAPDFDPFAGRPARDAYHIEPIGRLLDPGPQEEPGDWRSVADLLRNLGPHARDAAEALLEMSLRTTIFTASDELRRYDDARGDADALAEVFKDAASIKSDVEAEQVRTLLQRYGVLSKIVPAVTQMGLILKAEADGRILERRERKRREELHVALEEASKEIASRILAGQPEIGIPGLEVRIDELLAEIEAQTQAGQAATAQDRTRKDQIAAARATLNRLLQERPR